MTIKTIFKRLKELDALATCLPCLKDDSHCPSDIERMNVSLMPVMMCNLLMRCISPTMEDGYNCMNELLPTDPKKLDDQLTKKETKLKEVMSEMSPEDRRNGKGQTNTQKESSSRKKHVLAKANCNLKNAVPHIPSKATPKKVNKLCKL